MSLIEQAEEYYVTHYAGRGLAPKYVVELKKRLKSALRKGEKPSLAAKAFFKEKEITLKDKEEDTPKAAKPKAEAEAPVAAKATKTEKTPVVPLPTMEVTKMDRKSLKATIAQLRAAGVDIEYKKADDDGTLARKVNDALVKIPSPEMIATLETIDPAKLSTVLQKDCLGLFVDMRSVNCLMCTTQAECVKEYLANLKGNFSVFKDAMIEIKVEEAAEEIEEEEIAAVAEKTKKADKKAKAAAPETGKVSAIVWKAKRRIFVMDVANPNDEDDDVYSTVQAILDEVPSTMSELREIVQREWEYDDDAKFVNDWIIGIRDIEIIKFESDLTEDERAALVAAGAL